MRVPPQLSCGGSRIVPFSKNGVPICCERAVLVVGGIDDAGVREQERQSPPSVQLATCAARSAGHTTLFRFEAGPIDGVPRRFWLTP